MRSASLAGSPHRGTIVAGMLLLSASAALAQGVAPDQQRGVRGRVVVAAELWRLDAWPITGLREDALRNGAIVRRPLGHQLRPLTEGAPPLTVMLEGSGLRQENPETPTLKVAGLRFVPGSIVAPRAVVARVHNGEQTAITVVGGDGTPVKIAPGDTGDVPLKPPPPGPDGTVPPVVLSLAEWPFAKAVARVLPSGRVLPVKDGEIALQDIPGGEYTLTFFLGAEPIRQQPLVVPERGAVFIDATVSAKGAADVSVKSGEVVPIAPHTLPLEKP